jgi:hypothetical protein
MITKTIYEMVNDLNVKAIDGERYWTVVVLYNHVIYKRHDNGTVEIFDVVGK